MLAKIKQALIDMGIEIFYLTLKTIENTKVHI